jgi:hypothetical protein
VEECSDHGESRDWWRRCSDSTERGGRQETVIFGSDRGLFTVKVEIGGAAAQIVLREVADKRRLYGSIHHTVPRLHHTSMDVPTHSAALGIRQPKSYLHPSLLYSPAQDQSCLRHRTPS